MHIGLSHQSWTHLIHLESSLWSSLRHSILGSLQQLLLLLFNPIDFGHIKSQWIILWRLLGNHGRLLQGINLLFINLFLPSKGVIDGLVHLWEIFATFGLHINLLCTLRLIKRIKAFRIRFRPRVPAPLNNISVHLPQTHLIQIPLIPIEFNHLRFLDGLG